jgi:hypothetical protein
MILRPTQKGTFQNLIGEEVEIEEDFLFPLLKGTDIQSKVVTSSKNKVIVTQRRPGENNEYIKDVSPKLWAYLNAHRSFFEKRKSIIYKRNAQFSIFGIGDYSFKPYKVAISGFHKKPIFSLIPPIENKPAMLDDICNFISFDEFNPAFFSWILLNTKEAEAFLSSIVFLDSKRPYTKEALMRLNMFAIACNLKSEEVMKFYQTHLANIIRQHEFSKSEYETFVKNNSRNLFSVN